MQANGLKGQFRNLEPDPINELEPITWRLVQLLEGRLYIAPKGSL